MRRFRFRLERVLRYRTTREQIAYQALQEAIQQRAQLQAQIAQLQAEIQAVARTSVSPTEWSLRERVLETLTTRLQRLHDTLPLLLEQEAHAREVYLHTRREREALSRLRQRAYEQYQQELQRALQNAADEAVVYAYQRRLSEDSATGAGD
ncbi:MAG: flagellar export protein FliJ [Armatimonadota bacterium]|nr:flagellar export protein FliJ [Armatimonadota bacterium]